MRSVYNLEDKPKWQHAWEKIGELPALQLSQGQLCVLFVVVCWCVMSYQKSRNLQIS